MARIVAAHGIPYLATACTAYETDFLRKVETARDTKGFRYLEVMTPCPTGWGYDPALSRKIGREMVKLGIWPMIEIRQGRKLKVTKQPRFGDIKPHMRGQNRFRHLSDAELDKIGSQIAREWETLEHSYYTTELY
jgi:pyruvate ferredoxin oxidoreductase beta subunit